jgi:hypothetical protein
MAMTLGELLRQLCAQTPLTVSLPDDLPLLQPIDLMRSDYHLLIFVTILNAVIKTELRSYGGCVFGEWLANLCTGQTLWLFRLAGRCPWHADKGAVLRDISRLDATFGQAAYGNPKEVIRLYLLPSWDALTEHLPQIQRGVAAAFAEAKRWDEDRQKEGVR